MKYCTKCVMPETRPGISFDEQGVCCACQAFERRKQTDWAARWKEFEQLCDKYRGSNGDSYDCAIAVSGGKDSHFQVYLMKEVMHMNPILFTAEDNLPMTEAGMHNLKNISETFGCNLISMKPDVRLQKKLMRYMFETYGRPVWMFDRYLYTYPMHMAVRFNTPLLVYGENVSYEYGGPGSVETYSARDQLYNGVAMDVSEEELIANCEGVKKEDLIWLRAPTREQIAWMDPIYISYFLPWNSVENYEFAKSRGFHDLTHEWERTHRVEQFDQVDSRAYEVQSWLKYPKFGHSSATDYASRYVRYGLITREEAVQLVKDHDPYLDPLSVRDFCRFVGYSETEFWNIMDRFYNRDIFEKVMGHWVLKDPVWKQKA